jgi:hypothetical protein
VIHTFLYTDLTRCYDESGIEIPCAGSGQDAEFNTGHRISEKRFQVMTAVVLDSLTGLTWCRNANPAEFPLDWNAAHDFINEMNGVRASGRSDWRLPSRRELFTLISHEVFNPALSKDHPFENVFSRILLDLHALPPCPTNSGKSSNTWRPRGYKRPFRNLGTIGLYCIDNPCPPENDSGRWKRTNER